MNIKIKWRVSPAPTGRYKSFEKRNFPYAEYENGETLADMLCGDSYVPALHKDSDDLELKLRVMDYSGEFPKWRTLKARPTSIKSTKELLVKFLETETGASFIHPSYK